MKDMPILNNIQLIKIDSETKEVIKSNFTFGLYEDKECTKLIQQVDSNKREGTVLFEKLRYQKYYIKEISAPNNYQISEQIVELEINDKGIFVDGVELLKDKNSICSFTFENTKIPEVNTGLNINYILLFSIMAVSIIGIVVGIVILRKRNQN